MDIRPLRYFVTIAELGSFSAASRHLNVAQPALSRHIKALEADLGAKLLLRSPRGVIMTEPGERLFHHALSILRQIDLVPGVVTKPDHPVTGRVSIGLPTSASAILSAPLLVRAAQRFPGVRLHLIESLSGFLLEWVQNRRVDLAVLFDAEPSPTLWLKTMLVENLCIAGRPEAFPAGAQTLDFRALRAYPLVLPGAPHGLRRLLDSMARSHGIQLNVAYEVDSLIVNKQLAASGCAFSVLAEGAAQEECADGRLRTLKIVRPTISRSVSLAASALPGRTPACEEIAKLTLSLAQELVETGAWQAAMPPVAEAAD